MNFLKNILSTFIGVSVFFLLLFLIGLGVIGALMSEEKVEVADKSVLYLKLNQPIAEVENDDPIGELPLVGASPNAIGVIKLKNTIKAAKEDDKIKGIYLNAPILMTGFAHVEEIRDALIDFKSSGKFIVSYGEYYTEGAYYLASVADAVYLNPEGTLDFNGLDAEVRFYKGMLDKLEVTPQVFKVGDFKSAVEPYLREDMSEPNRLQLSSILNSVYGNMISNISESRGMMSARLREISDKMEVRNPQDALELKLIDGLYYTDQVQKDMKERLGLLEDDKIEFITYKKYKKTVSTYKSSENKIAVIVASGEIVPGEGEQGYIGSDRYVKEIRKARLDEDIKAIIIRINSPGGSFVASDVMWREIQLAKQEKPVIASMANVAASGGYYMAMGCDTIVAQPNTITGSIGIFGVIFNASDFLKNKIGITHDMVKTGEFSSVYTLTRPLTEIEGEIIQTDINEGYETFTSKAAEGRGMHIDSLKAVASGRVWSGTQALENGLVDVLGDFEDAVKIAADKADLEDDYKLRFYPEPKPLIERFLGNMEEEAKTKALKESLGDFYPYLNQIQKMKYMQGPQARMPFELEIR